MAGLLGSEDVNASQAIIDKIGVPQLSTTTMLTKDAPQKPPKAASKSKPTCARCKNHGKTNYRIGHKGSCPYEHCLCDLCSATQMRNKSMAQTMANERKLSALKRQQSNSLMADSSCSSTTPVMCSSAIKPEYHDTFDTDPQTPDTTSYERPVKRLRTSPPSSDAQAGGVQVGYGYLQQDARGAWAPYDCLRQGVDPRYINYPGMSPFPQPSGTHSHPTLEDRKRLLEPAYKFQVAASTGRANHPSASYQVNALLRDSNSDIMMQRQLLQQITQPEDGVTVHKTI